MPLGENWSWTAAEGGCVILELHAAEGESAGPGEEEVEFFCGVPWGDAAGADIGNAVSLGIGATRPRSIAAS